MEYYLDALRKYAVFEGRATRKQYWMFVLINVLISIVVSIIFGIIHLKSLYYLYSLALLVPGIAIAVRRLHDMNRSGWWELLCFIPIIGWLILLYFLVQKSDSGPNRFGPAAGGMPMPEKAPMPQPGASIPPPNTPPTNS